MTNYFTYDKNGNYTKSTSRPESGYYTAQEKPGGGVILYEADPGGDPKKLDSWDRPGDMDYVLTPDGSAYKVKLVDGVYRADPDKRDDKHDRKAPVPPPPTEEEQKKNYMEGLEKDPQEGDRFDDFRLKIKLPPGSPSDDLKTYISLANHQLEYLEKQMGDKKKPIALTSPEKGKDTLIWDNNLSKSFTDSMGHGAEAQAGGKGAAVDAYKSASDFLDELDAQWSARDDDFKTENLKLTADNDRTYRKMWDKVQSAHEDIWAALERPYAGYYGGSTFNKSNFTAPGIQNVVEEGPIYGIVRETVQFCVDQVADYAHRAESVGKKYGDFPGYPTDKGDEKGDKGDEKGDKGDKGDDKGDKGNNSADNNSGANNNGGANNGAYNGGFNGGFDTGTQGTAGTTAQQAGQNEDFSSTYDDLLGPDATGSADTTQTALDNGTGNTTASRTVPASLPTTAMQGGTGSGSGSGGTTATPATMPAGAGNDTSGLMAQMALMSALQGNPSRQPSSDDRGYDDDRDSRHERDRARERERATQASTTQQTAQASPAGVTAPTYAGTPPPVTTPGTTVDVPIDNTNVKASPPVAEALQKQVQNVALDAVSAYKGTAGELTADHPPAVVNGPGELKTGDILQWERHSALIVRDQEHNRLFVLDGGHLVPLDPNNPPLKEKYGNFAGYLHPTGLDTGNAGLGTAAAPPPTTSQAQQPTAPPPVGPPPQQT
ncbi:hypothetical protein [Nocardia sp. R7R-8]|uniref:hypothetical protein n=1 Tax=Nocardia sp. R7R-8 TaxID=3459304 RepID=UPI00403E0823